MTEVDRLRFRAEQLAHFGRRLLDPQELRVVAGIRLVNGRAHNGAAVEPFHVLLHGFLRPARLGQRDVEEGFFRHFLEGAGRVH